MGAKNYLKKDGRFPIFFFFWDAHLLFFLLGELHIDAHRPPIFFFGGGDAQELKFCLSLDSGASKSGQGSYKSTETGSDCQI